MTETYYEAHRDERIKYQEKYVHENKHIRKEWEHNDRIKNPRKYHDRQIRVKYGLTYEQLVQMYVFQDGCCAICKEKFKNRKSLTVDHNHTTKRVRGLLCHNCNRGLGHFKDNPQFLIRASEYVAT